MEYIYLDWNVIQYMKHSTAQNSINGPTFAALVRKLSNKYRFPFSEGHLKDLAVSFKLENRSFIENDLKYLIDLSGGYALDKDLNLVLTNEAKIFEFFNEMITEVDDEPNIDISGEDYHVDIEKLPKNDLLRPLLESNGGVLDAIVMKKLISILWTSFDDPELYKSLRNYVAELKN